MKLKKSLATIFVALAISAPALAGCNPKGGNSKPADSTSQPDNPIDQSYQIVMSGTAIVGEKLSFILNKDGTPVVSGFAFEGKTQADKDAFKFDEDGITAECLKEGNFTIVAKVNGSVVTELAISVTKLEISTIKAAMDDAIKDIPFNGKSGAASAKTEKVYTVQGKVVALPLTKTDGKYDGNVLIDDGTEILPLVVYGDQANLKAEQGDSVQVTCKFTNYYGVLEGIATTSTADKQYSLYPDNLKVINKSFRTQPAVNMTASDFAAYYETAKANGATGCTTYTHVKHVNLKNVLGAGGTGAGKMMTMEGDTSECEGKIAITSTTSCDVDVTEEKATNISGYAVGGNSSSKYVKVTVVSQEDPKVESISIATNTGGFVVAPGATLNLSAVFAPAGTTAPVKWYVLDETIATVDEDTGVLTGVSNGYTAVRCVAEGLFPSYAMIQVDNNPCVKVDIKDKDGNAIRNIELLNLENQTFKLTAVRTGKNANKECGDTLTWISGDENVVTVNANGVVTAVGNGATTITAQAGQATATINVKVRNQKIADLAHAKVGDVVDTYGYYMGDYVKASQYGYWLADGEAGIYVYADRSKITGDVAEGAIIHVKSTIEAYSGSKQVSKTNLVAEVVESAEGLETPVALEYTENTVLDETQQGRYVVIEGECTKVSTTPNYGSANVTYTMKVGEKTVSVYLAKNYTTQERYEEFARNVKAGRNVTVAGYVSAYKSNVTDFSTLAESNYQVINPVCLAYETIAPTGISLNKTSAEVEQGASLTLTATVTPEGADGTVAWTVTGNDKVTVDQTGKVTVAADAVANSTATVTATIANFSATCTITVKAKQVTVPTVLEIDSTNLTKVGSGSGYAPFNGTRTIGNYEVTTADVMATKLGDIGVLQMKKTSGTITVGNISTTKVRIVGETTYNNTEAKYLPTITYGGSTFAKTDTEAAEIFGAKTDTGSVSGQYPIYEFVVEFEVSAAAAGNLVIKMASGGAFYAKQILFY